MSWLGRIIWLFNVEEWVGVMNVIYITGMPGSGKSILELNIRYNLGVEKVGGDFVDVGGEVLFLGNYIRQDGSGYLRYPGLDAFKTKDAFNDIVMYIRNAELMNFSFVIMSGTIDIMPIVEKLEEHDFYCFLNRRTIKKVRRLREVRTLNGDIDRSDEFLEKWHIKMEKRLEKWLEYEGSNLRPFILTGNLRHRVEVIMKLLDKQIIKKRLIRKMV